MPPIGCSTLVELLQWQAQQRPDQLAIRFLLDGEEEEASTSYQGLDAQARAIAALLQQEKAQGERVLLLYRPSLDYIAALFGCFYAGAVAVPAYPPRLNSKLSRLQAIAADAQATFALTTASTLAAIQPQLPHAPELQRVRWLATDGPAVPEAAGWRPPSVTADDLAFLQFTSGSTSRPKGVMVSHANLIHHARYISSWMQADANTRAVFWLPPYHDMGLFGGILLPLYAGAQVTLMAPAAFLQKPLRWLQAISRERGTGSAGPNFAYEQCLRRITPQQRDQLDLSSWRFAFCGAEPVRSETLRRFAEFFAPCGFRSEAFVPSYGLAEATLMVTGVRPAEPPHVVSFAGAALEENRVEEATGPGSRLLVSCGLPLPDHQVIIVDPETQVPCPPARVGEIWTAGPSVAMGYWNKPEETARTFQARPALKPGCAEKADTCGLNKPFLRTGDLGFLKDGGLFVTGRIRDLLIVRGTNHYPQDIEWTVENCHPGLRPGYGAAFTIEIGDEERLVVVQEVDRHHKDLDVNEVSQMVRRTVAEHHGVEVHAVVLIREQSLPLTSSGKVQRHLCREGFLQGTLAKIGSGTKATRKAAAAEIAGSTASHPGHRNGNGDGVHTNGRAHTAAEIQAWLVARLADLLEVEPAAIGVQQPFQHFGLDSAKAVLLSGELEDWLKRRLPPTLVWDYPTIEVLARHLAGEPGVRVLDDARPQKTSAEPLAVVGIGLRFPGAESPAAFGRLLREGVDAITEVPPDRWDVDAFYDPDPAAPGKICTRWGGFLNQVDRFDPSFFGIAPREAVAMDPQQRLLLEVAWEALENAGWVPERLAGTPTGVFIGISSNDYSRLLAGTPGMLDAYAGTGNAFSIAANRLSYALGLQGPSLAVDTACSSSLVAVHLACRSLRAGECNVALAGGVNLILLPELTIAFSQARMMAQDGRCKTFDAAADGYVRSEGCGVVVLKRLSDAVRDGDSILALVRGSAVNQDGRSNGLTAPNGPAQQAVIRQALADASVQPAEVGYVETHGTGTPLGDPIEVQALAQVFGPGRSAEQPLAIGSVKTNLGHMEAAAGIAGLIKVVLALRQAEIPPHLHLHTPSPHIPWDQLPVVVPTRPMPWPEAKGQRLAGVSSFGFGGTNAHIILEQAPRPVEARSADAAALPASERPLHLLCLSAPHETGVREVAGRFATHMADHPEEALADVAFTANTCRSHFAQRQVIVSTDLQEARAQLAAVAAGQQPTGVWQGKVASTKPRVAFLFTGQGSQYVGMGRSLFETQPVFRQALQECNDILRPCLPRPLLDVLYPLPGTASPLDETGCTQPALFAIEYALAQLWRSWGVEPAWVLGHSVGEYVAACVAGVFSLEDGLRLIAERGRLMQALPAGGAMAAVLADETRVAAALAPYRNQVALAALNGPEQVVISGAARCVQSVVANLEASKIRAQLLTVSHAFHSPLMEPILEPFRRVAETVPGARPRIPLVSNLGGRLLVNGDTLDADYWVRHIREPVAFSAGVRALAEQGCQYLLEIGPSPVLLGLARRCLGEEKSRVWLPSLRRGQDDWRVLLESLAVLYVHGTEVDWAGFDRDFPRHKLTLPTYPFQRQRYWVEPRTPGQNRTDDGATAHPLLGEALRSADRVTFENCVELRTLDYLRDHRVFGAAVFPAAGFLEMALAAARAELGGGELLVEQVQIQQPLLLPEKGKHTLQFVLTTDDAAQASFQVLSRGSKPKDRAPSWTRHVTGRVQALAGADAAAPVAVEDLQRECSEVMDAGAYYQQLESRGLAYGPAFRGISQLWRGRGQALSWIEMPEPLAASAAAYQVHPVILDAAMQTLAAALPEQGGDQVWLPLSVERMQLSRAAGSRLYCLARLQEQGPETLKAALCLFDETGAVVLQIEGLALKLASRQGLQQAARPDFGSWLYEIDWQHRPLTDPPVGEPGRWLIFADQESPAGIGLALADRLRAGGHDCIVVLRGETYQPKQPGSFAINPGKPADYDRLLAETVPDGSLPFRGIVHLWSLDARPVEPTNPMSLAADQLPGPASLLHLVQALARGRKGASPQLWTVTRDATRGLSVNQAPLWGLGRVISLEHPDLPCISIDLDQHEGAVDHLCKEVLAPEREEQVAFREGQRYVARLISSAVRARAEERLVVPGPSFQLQVTSRGVLDNLRLHAIPGRLPGPGEVQVQVRAAGLNFRDVLNVLGMYPGDPGPLGGECAGVITAVGPEVQGLAVGDEVVALAPASLASTLTTDARIVVRKPAALTFEAAAAAPVVFLTASIGLERMARLRAGERVLIHAAAGGVGLAAVQIAQRIGAEVYATASPGKWDQLRALGVKHILNSRTLDFAEQIRQQTGGQGVDVVLNSLADAYIPQSLSILARNGRFVEIGKRGIWTPDQVAQVRPDVVYHTLALDAMLAEDPAGVGRLLNEIMDRFAAGEWQPLRHAVYPIQQAVSAFRTMQQARHVGKIVLAMPRMAEGRFRPDGSYLITGGLGGLGLKVARWMVERGARHLVLVGRSGATAAAEAVLAELRQAGAEVEVARADVAQEEQLASVLQAARPPLRGVIHAAGTLDDGVLTQQTWPRFQGVLAPKVQGAWNLHRLTRDLPLDFFVLFSSSAALIGSAGQGSYAAANAFLDGLAHQRRALGLPGLSINWGPWAEVGMAAGLDERHRRQWAALGLSTLSVPQGLDVLEHALRQDFAQVGVLPIDWARFLRLFPTGTAPKLLANLAPSDQRREPSSDLHARLQQAAPAERADLLAAYLQAQVGRVLGLDAARLPDRQTGFVNLGMDSLMAVELRNRLQADLGPSISLPATLIFDYPTIDALSKHLADKLQLTESRPLPQVPARPQRAAPADDPIAIVGLGCRFPGSASDPEAFWSMLHDGVDAIREVPPERWDLAAYYDPNPDKPGKTYARHGAFLDQVDRFDAAFFGISPREAASLDPQQRLLLETSWEALENAGQAPDRLVGSNTGVFVGICTNDYSQLLLARGDGAIDAYMGTGNSHSVAAGRLSYLLGLQGPSLAIDTACSSSLVAVHNACQSLRLGECRQALAGGVNALLSPQVFLNFCRARMLSPAGRCKTFDADADGYVRGEGCGMVVLKRLSDALADGDHVLALIRGSAINQDGRTSGLTAPNGPSQQAVIRKALAAARIEPAQVDYVEAHGTATALGDPIEVQALGAVFAEGRAKDRPLLIGSVKTNIGHLEGAAGIAGLIKVVLAMQHETLPPHLNFQKPNPMIAWDELPVAVTRERQPWATRPDRRIAGVSSFGFSGTNAHVILEEAPAAAAPVPAETGCRTPERPLHVLCLSARDGEALRELAGRHEEHLRNRPTERLADVAFTVNAGRSHYEQRLAVIAGSAAQARDGLVAWIAGQESPRVCAGKVPPTGSPKVAFLFPEEEAIQTGMGQQLYETQPTFRKTLDRCEELLRPYLDRPLLAVLYPPPGAAAPPAAVQPAVFALQYALAELWRSWGIEPAAVLGQGVGEYVAACVAGVFPWEDALRLVAERARCLAGGEGKLDEFEARFAQVPTKAPQLRFISSFTGEALQDSELCQAVYWRRQACQPPSLARGLAALQEQGCRWIVEIGPRLSLHHAAEENGQLWLPSLLSGQDDWQQLLESLGLLYARGCSVDWAAFDRDYPRCKLALPTYPFQRQRHWIDTAGMEPAEAPTTQNWHDWLYRLEWQPQPLGDRGWTPGQEPGNWLIFADREGTGVELAELLEARGENCSLVFAGDTPATPGARHCCIDPADRDAYIRLVQEGRDRPWRGVVHLWSLDDHPAEAVTAESLQAAQVQGAGSVLSLVQALAAASPGKSPRLWLVTRGTQEVTAGPAETALAAAPLWGLGRVIALECPHLGCTRLDLAPVADRAEARALCREIGAADVEDQVALRGDTRYVARLAPGLKGPDASGQREESPVSLRPDRTYLITGGLGALGLQVASWMVKQGGRHLVLVGRSGSSEKAEPVVAELRGQGAQIVIAKADVGQPQQLAQVLEEAARSLPPLAGVVHAAGIIDDALLGQQNWDRLTRVMASKMAGAWNLHLMTRDLPLDFFVLFSSAASLLGSPGQANYAAANAFLDGLAQHRRSHGLPALSLNWGPWAGAGMGEARGRRLAAGLEPIAPEQALEALGQLLGRSSSAQVAVLPIDWPRFLGAFPPGGAPPLLTALAQTEQSPESEAQRAEQQRWLQSLTEAAPSQRRQLLLAHVKEQVGQVLRLPAGHALDLHRGLTTMGLDSLMAVELGNRLQMSLGRPLPTTVMFENPTIAAIADYLLNEVLFPASVPENETTVIPATEASVEDLAEADIAALLADKLTALERELP